MLYKSIQKSQTSSHTCHAQMQRFIRWRFLATRQSNPGTVAKQVKAGPDPPTQMRKQGQQQQRSVDLLLGPLAKICKNNQKYAKILSRSHFETGRVQSRLTAPKWITFFIKALCHLPNPGPVLASPGFLGEASSMGVSNLNTPSD